MNWFSFKLHYTLKLSDWYRFKLYPIWDRLIHSKKCSCGHPLWMHVCYEHGTCIHGICLSDTFLYGNPEDIKCCCDGFNSMWNEEYPPNQPELRKTDKERGSGDES